MIVARPDHWSKPLTKWYNNLITDILTIKSRAKTKINITIAENEEDWEYVFVNAGNGKLQMAVF